MTSYLDTNIISIKETFSESLVKIRHDDVILRHVTSFSYIFLYNDVIDKCADVSKNNDVTTEMKVEMESSYVTLQTRMISS